MTTSNAPARLPAVWPAALVAVVLLALDLAVDVVYANLLLRQDRLLAALDRDPTVFTLAEVEGAEGPVVAVSAMAIVAFLLSVLAVGVFLRTAWLTAQRLQVRDLRYGPRWAVFGWFVPVMGLFVPKRIVDDLWRATDVDSPQPYWSSRPRPALVVCWWTAFVISLLLARVVSSGEWLLAVVQLVVELAAGLLGLAVVVALAVRLTRCAAVAGAPLTVPAQLRLRDVPGRSPWLPTALVAVAGTLCACALVAAVQQGSRLPEPLRAREAAALSLPPASPGLSLPSRPGPLLIPTVPPDPPSPSPTRPTLDPSGPFEDVLLRPPSLQRVEDDPVYAGSYDLERFVATLPEGGRTEGRRNLSAGGFVRAQQAAWAGPSGFLEVLVVEFEDEQAAADYAAGFTDVEGGEPFPVDTPGGRGVRERVGDGRVVDAVTVSVGRLSFVLFLSQAERFSTNQAEVLLRLQHQAATGAR